MIPRRWLLPAAPRGEIYVGAAVHAQHRFDAIAGRLKGGELLYGGVEDIAAMIAKGGVVVLFPGHAPSQHAQVAGLGAGQLYQAHALFEEGDEADNKGIPTRIKKVADS